MNREKCLKSAKPSTYTMLTLDVLSLYSLALIIVCVTYK